MAALRALVLAAILCAAAPAARGATITIRAVGSSDIGTNTLLVAGPGSEVDLEVVLDTQDLTLEGYHYGLDVTGGSISGLSVAHAALSGLVPDFVGAPVLDQAAGTVRNVNQSKLLAGPGLAAGVYVLDTLSFLIESTDAGILTVSGGLFGQAFGLGEGSCPGTIGGCGVQFFSLQIVPEPGSAGLLAGGLAALAARRRRQRRATGSAAPATGA